MEFIFGIVILVLDVWAIYNVLQSESSTGAKLAWSLGVIVFPVIGFLIWGLTGPRGAPPAIA